MSANAAAIPLSLSYYTVPELTPPDMVRAAAASGFRHVGLRLLHGQPGSGLAPLMQDAELRRETVQALRDHGVEALDASGARLVPSTDVAALAAFLETAAEMGARHILATADDPDTMRLEDRLVELCERAASLGLTVDLEFVPWMTVPDVRSAARLVRAIGHPALGIAVDALHFSRSRSRVDDLADVPADRLRYLQLCDAPAEIPTGREELLREATQERQFPGDGGIDLVGLLRAMPRGIPVALEIPTATLASSMPAAVRLKHAVSAARRVLALAYD